MVDNTSYEMGREAFANGVRVCPFGAGNGDPRIIPWWNGYLDCRTEKRMGWTRIEWGDKNQQQRRKRPVKK